MNDETVLLTIIAVSNAVIAVCGLATLVLAKLTRADVKTLEINTNSIREELVARTAEASEAKGRDEQRKIGEDKASILLSQTPLPVADEKTAAAVDKVADILKEK